MATERTGFYPVGTISGSPWQGALREFPVAAGASDIFIGDPVVLVGDGTVNTMNACAVDEANIVGIMVSKVVASKQDPAQINLDHSNTDPKLETLYSDGAGDILVACAPDLIMEVDADAALTKTAVGNNANIVKGTSGGNTSTGKSGMRLDATVATASTNPFTVYAKPKGADVYANTVHVIFNNHAFKQGATGQ